MPRVPGMLVVSSGDAAQIAMYAGAVGRRVYHIGPQKDDGFFTDRPEGMADAPAVERVALEEAEGIVCTGPFDEMTETPGGLPRHLPLRQDQGPGRCSAPTPIWSSISAIGGSGAPARLRQLYDEMGGTSLYFGKPHPPIYDLARRRLEAAGGAAARILAIGDGIATDIQGAMGEGIDALFVTGGLAAGEFGDDCRRPPTRRGCGPGLTSASCRRTSPSAGLR